MYKLFFILCFVGLGIVASVLLLVITRTIKEPNLWYYSFEYWISPTYLNFLLASGLTILAFYVGKLLLEQKGLIVFPAERKTIHKISVLAIILVLHPILFWLNSNKTFYPASFFLSVLLTSLAISFILWIFSKYFFFHIFILFLVICLIAPNIPSLLKFDEPVQYIYPVSIPLFLGLCGYWLAIAQRLQKTES